MKLLSRKPPNMYNYLVGFGDTEGVDGKNGLWSVSILFKALVQSIDGILTKQSEIKFKERMFHLLNFNSTSPDSPSHTTAKALHSHFDALQYLKREYDLRGIVICFWNASHDRKQLQIYEMFNKKNPEFQIHYVDMIYFAKSISKFNSYKLESINKKYAISYSQTHTSLQDTIDMLRALSFIYIDYKNNVEFNKLSTIKQIKDKYKSYKRDYLLKDILEFDMFLSGLIIEKYDNKLERKLSFGFNQLDKVSDNYHYFKLDDIEYKVRKGWDKDSLVDYKGCGLYESIDSKYKLIRKKEDKCNILDEYIRTKTKKEVSIIQEQQLIELE